LAFITHLNIRDGEILPKHLSAYEKYTVSGLTAQFVSIGSAGTDPPEGLLDIETSISKQLEASVLIGRQLNFNKAREYALMGDIDNMTKSIVEQVGSISEYNKLNIIQRQSLAEAIGISVDDLSRMVNRQDELNKNTGKFSKL